MSKKVIEIEGFADETKNRSLYGFSNFSISFVTRPINGKRYQVSQIHTCRDYAHEFTRVELMCRNNILDNRKDGNAYGYYPNGNRLLDIHKLRLLVFSNGTGVKSDIDNLDINTNIDITEIERRLFFGKQILNFYESEFGWTKSKISRAKYSSNVLTTNTAINAAVAKSDFWHFIGPKWWMRNPHLLSLYTMTLRASVRYGLFEFETVEDIAKAYKKISCSGIRCNDDNILGNMSKFLPILVKNKDKVFEGLTEKELYHFNSKNIFNFHGAGGISSLCSATTITKELNEKVKFLHHVG